MFGFFHGKAFHILLIIGNTFYILFFNEKAFFQTALSKPFKDTIAIEKKCKTFFLFIIRGSRYGILFTAMILAEEKYCQVQSLKR